MKNKFVKTRLVKIVCECCGHEFYAEPGIITVLNAKGIGTKNN